MPTQTISRCGGTTGGTALFETLIAANVKAIYKLDELSGNTAADSSGNGYDATTYTTRIAPVWGNPAGPPGTSTAHFTQSPSLTGVRNVAFPGLTTDWTILGWFNQDSDIFVWGAGQGSGIGTSQGFALGINSTHEVGPSRGWVSVGNAPAGSTRIFSDNALVPGTWYMLAGTRSGTTVTLYVNGAAQSAPSNPGYAPTTGTLVGQNNGTFGMEGYLSWVCFFDAALSAAQIGAIYTSASL